MSDIHALSGAYAVDALDDIERIQFQRHLAGCPTCQAEVDSLTEAGALLAETVLREPPASLRDRVLADIATVRPLPPVVRTPEPAEAPGRRRWFPALVAAAAALTAIGVGSAVVQPWEDETSQGQPSAADRVRSAPDAESFTQRFDDGSRATLLRSASLNEAVVVTDDLAPAPSGKVYELWLQHDDDMVSAGLMPDGSDNVVPLEGDAAAAQGFGISVEPAGGSTTGEPSPDIVAYVAFDKA